MNDTMFVHIECRTTEVLCRIPISLAEKVAELDTEFKERLDRAKRRIETK